MSSLYHIRHGLPKNALRVNHRQQEKFGTVIRAGRMRKTVTVFTSNYHWVRKYKAFKGSHSKFHCHDEEEFCKIGDKVIISRCLKLSKFKYYYVRTIAWPVGRQHFYRNVISKDERRCWLKNKEIMEGEDILGNIWHEDWALKEEIDIDPSGCGLLEEDKYESDATEDETNLSDYENKIENEDRNTEEKINI